MSDIANKELHDIIGREYQHGFVTSIESDQIPFGLNEDVVRLISAKKMSRHGYWNGVCKRINIGLP